VVSSHDKNTYSKRTIIEFETAKIRGHTDLFEVTHKNICDIIPPQVFIRMQSIFLDGV
jgi:hypothetical protein